MQRFEPDSAVLADLASRWRSAYVHLPFCRRRCPYCDFAIVDESSGGFLDHDIYIEALIDEIGMEAEFGPLDAVNFGGGTPSRLHPEQLGRVIEALTEKFGVVDGIEISLEVNPEDWSEDFGKGLHRAGFNRVSVGAQSFDPVVLRALGRQHTEEMIKSTVQDAHDVGIRSVGLDLIFGHPLETTESWERTVGDAVSVGVDHISTYSLTVEHGTELSREVAAGAKAPDDDLQVERYHYFEKVAREHGFVRYEISNHAREGHVCKYNLSTWAHGEYVAFGIGAHDHRLGERSRNHRRVDRYIEAIRAGERPRIAVEHLSVESQERDTLMVGLRLAAGTPMTETAHRFVTSKEGERLLAAGVIKVRESRVIVVDPMLADTAIREVLSVSSTDC